MQEKTDPLLIYLSAIMTAYLGLCVVISIGLHILTDALTEALAISRWYQQGILLIT